MKIIAILAVLFTAFPLRIISQEKHEYVIIEYSIRKHRLSLSKNGNEFSVIKTYADSLHFNANPIISQVRLFEEKGWELISLNTQLAGICHRKEVHFAYMRRKLASH